jgi:hypothetical protein
MSDYSTDDIEFIKRHTSYESDEIIIEKLKIHGTAIEVIKDSFNINKTKTDKTIENSSLNQEIYRQIRKHMDIFL